MFRGVVAFGGPHGTTVLVRFVPTSIITKCSKLTILATVVPSPIGIVISAGSHNCMGFSGLTEIKSGDQFACRRLTTQPGMT